VHTIRVPQLWTRQVDTFVSTVYRAYELPKRPAHVNILVIGGGGREHALVWRLAQSPRVRKIWCAPGNGGIRAQAECVDVNPGDLSAIVSLAEKVAPDLTVVGPELPLVNGIGDAFRGRGWPILAPSRQAAQLEGGKIFAKDFLERHQIPTAKRYGVYDSPRAAYAALEAFDWPLVIKADGLCAGKGVVLPSNPNEARDFIERALEKGELGVGGRRLLIEEALEGQELSFILLTDGQRYASLVPTRDHKRAYDGNQGPNTGGMGAYSTDELLPPDVHKTILENVVAPTISGLAADGILYQGFLYFGLMLTASGPKVLEFNCRLGDPEAQAIVTRMNFDLAAILADVARGQLNPEMLRWKPGASVCIVLAASGYPGTFESGKTILGLTDLAGDTGLSVFHAGTKRVGDAMVTSGGRVLGVTAYRASLDAAVAAAYRAVTGISFEGMRYRKDIAARSNRVRAARE
jgi:phosphoribosylamine--glycine ligase